MNDSDWDDRAVDAALHELHGSRPPDLSARVLLALAEPHQGPLPRLRPPTRWTPAGWLAAAALLVVALAVTGSALWRSAATPLPAEISARLELTSFGGGVDCVETAAGQTLVTAIPPGATGTFVARVGNRLRHRHQSLCELGPFGVVAAGPDTELEVRSMEFSRKNGVVAASALTLSVVAGVATWYTLQRSETAVAGEVLRMEARSDGADGAAALASENERLRQRLQQLEQQNEALQLQVSRAAAPTPAPVPAAAAAAEAAVPAKGEVVFDDARYAAALADIDWKLIGDTQREMGPLLVQLVEAMAAEDGEVPTELAIKINELNQKLVAQLPALLKAGLPGFGPNGFYTHPLVVANSLASQLAAAGQPLNDAQRASIAGLVRSFGIENDGIAAQTREFDLEHLLAEADMKDRFYKEVSTLLTPEQFGSMYPAGATAYEGASLFSTGLMTRPYVEAVASRDAADFARIATNKLGEKLGFDEATEAQVRAVVERVAKRSPELWQDPTNGVETKLRMLKTGRTPAALRHQLAVMREIQRNVSLTPEQKKKLASMKHILVPVPR